MASRGIETHLVTVGESFGMHKQDGVYIHTFSVHDYPTHFLGQAISILNDPHNSHIIQTSTAVLSHLKRIERRFGQIDVIHAHYFTTSLAPLFLQKVSKKHHMGPRLVLHHHSEPSGTVIGRWLEGLYDYHFAISDYLRLRLIQELGVPPRNTVTVNNAVDTGIFHYNDQLRVTSRNKLRLNADEKIILFAGRIVPEKGLHHLIAALSKVASKYPKTKLLVAGPKGQFDSEQSQDYFMKLDDLARKLGVGGNVEYLGHLSQESVLYAYNASDVVAVPSLIQDACPSVILEALACGKPTVAYAVGGIPEMLKGLPTTTLVRPGSINDLAAAIGRSLESGTELRDQNSKTLRMFVERRFSINAIVDQIVGYFQAGVAS
jgi:spore coat protein SA